MPLALSAFGVSAPGGIGTFCYAQFRAVKVGFRYRRPSLPKAAADAALSRFSSQALGFELQIWDEILSEEESIQVEQNLALGSLRLPERCPIEPGATLSGAAFADTLIAESFGFASVEGVGPLKARGFAIEGSIPKVALALQTALKRKAIGDELEALLALIDREAGLPSLIKSSRRLGVVELLTRRCPNAERRPIEVEVVSPSPRGTKAAREIVVRRPSGAPATDLLVALKASSGEAVILDRLIAISAKDAQIRLHSPAHVTNVEFKVYDSGTGDLLDQEQQILFQQFSIGLIGQITTDELSPAVRAAPTELVTRPRIRTGAITIGGANRAAGFDVMKRNRLAFDALAGPLNWKPETRFFPADTDAQLDVIRWIKEKVEGSDIKEAFLVDPFLGSDALQRVVLRHGNESIKLIIIISPGNIDPDASTTNAATGSSKHITNLIRVANAMEDKLCGEIEIFHVQRGNGTQQAFHDRYLGLVSRDGARRVFLLSNSLNKAAGYWPFAISEVSAPTAGRIAEYVAALKQGEDIAGKQLKAALIWSSETAIPTRSTSHLQENPFESLLGSVYFELSEINMRGRIFARKSTDQVVDRLAKAVPPTLEDGRLCSLIVDAMFGRDHFLPAIITRFSELPQLKSAASLLERALVDQLLVRLRPEAGLFGIPEQIPLLLFAAAALSRRPKGTDFVRNQMNPLADRCARTVEIGRVAEKEIAHWIAGLSLVVVGLELANVKSAIPINFRIGIANDYVHLLGRLLSSSICRKLFSEVAEPDDYPGMELAREALRIVRALASDEALELKESTQLLFADRMIPSTLLE